MTGIGGLLDRFLPDTCTVAARGDTAVDGDNQPVPAYPSPATGVRCRFMALTEQELLNATVGGARVYTHAILLPASAPVAPRALIRDIAGTDAAGSPVTLDAGPFEVVEVLPAQSSFVEFSRALVRRVGG